MANAQPLKLSFKAARILRAQNLLTLNQQRCIRKLGSRGRPVAFPVQTQTVCMFTVTHTREIPIPSRGLGTGRDEKLGLTLASTVVTKKDRLRALNCSAEVLVLSLARSNIIF